MAYNAFLNYELYKYISKVFEMLLRAFYGHSKVKER